ncbi:unnamed protein product [Ixodes pacificus]
MGIRKSLPRKASGRFRHSGWRVFMGVTFTGEKEEGGILAQETPRRPRHVLTSYFSRRATVPTMTSDTSLQTEA